MRKKKLAKNTISSLLFQVTTIICGFILPRVILLYYGSEINGLVNSITQFLQIISFLELGVGTVVQSALYKPLAEKDNSKISEIIASAGNFFKRIAYILLAYVVVLVLIYPYIANQNFGLIYTGTLIVAMSISSFAQYYFGVVDRLLLTADQRGYIQYNAQTITLLLNTFVSVILISNGFSIQLVKLTTSLIYLLRPLILRIYVNKKYSINRRIKYTGEPIKQKWNGLAQHIAAIILDGTDNIVLTIFSTLSAVSIYSAYNLVVFGVKQLFMSLFNGVQSLIGELLAKEEYDTLNNFFAKVEWILHTGVTIVFSCTGILLVPFVMVYTTGVTDADYYQPLFAIILTAANAMHCLRLPYNVMILAGGHFKQTQSNYIIAAAMNVVISIIAVHFWGLIGVAIGTFVAMLYQTIWMAWYNSKHFINWPILNFIKQIATDVVIALLSVLISNALINYEATSYVQWITLAIKVFIIVISVSAILNGLLYNKIIKGILKKKIDI